MQLPAQPETTSRQPVAVRLALRIAPWLAIGLVALLVRTLDLGGFVIEDEARYWLDRSYRFLKALETGDYGATAISTHPGVTTMWSGSLGTLLKRQLLTWGLLDAAPFPTTLALMRLPAALANAAGILAGYALLRRMLPVPIATLAALLWAADPLTIAYSRVLHVDGLMTTFATLSILAACAYWYQTRHAGLLVLSGACAGLAIMSKSPGLVVLPVVGLVALWGACEEGWSTDTLRRGARLLLPLLGWGTIVGATLVLVWPAVWADPLRVYELLRIGVEVEGGSPHVQGNFFLGQRDDEPGALFYPVAVALRLTPWAMLGLLVLPWAWRSLVRTGALDPAGRRSLLMLVVFVLVFTVALSIFPKKLNRYIVAAFPALNVLAAVGLAWGAERLATLWTHWTGIIGHATEARDQHQTAQALIGGVALLAALNAIWWHPYSIAYFNQALGGAQAGPRTFLIGSGEGLAEAAAWLNAQPDITGVVVATTMMPPLQPYLRPGAQSFPRQGENLPDSTGYVLIYVRNAWDEMLPPFDRFQGRATPLHTVRIHGVAYAWIYQVPPPIANNLQARFGEHIHLSGYEAASNALRANGTLSLTLQWRADAPLAADYLMFAHVLAPDGQRVGQIDAPPAGPATPTGTWQPGRVQTWNHPLPLPTDLPPGNYWLALGLYDPADPARLPLAAPAHPPTGAPDAGGNALLLPLTLP